MRRLPVVAPEPELFRDITKLDHELFLRAGAIDATGNYPEAKIIPVGEYIPLSFAREFYERADHTAFPSMFLPVAKGKPTFASLGIPYETIEPYLLLIEDRPLGHNPQVSLTIDHLGSLDWDGNGIRDWLFGCRILLYKQNVDLGCFLLVLNPQPTGLLDVRVLSVSFSPPDDVLNFTIYYGTAARDYLFTVMRDKLPAIYPRWTPPARAEDLPWRDAPGMEGVGYVEHVDESRK